MPLSPKGSLLRETLQTLNLALPMILGQLGGMAMAMVDAAMVGRGLGTPSLAAVTFAVNLTHIPFVSAFGWVSALSVLMARAVGEGDQAQAKAALRHGLVFVGLYGVGLIVGVSVGFPCLGWLGNLGQPEAIMPLAGQYLPWYVGALALTLLHACLRASWEARNRAWIPLLVQASAVGLNALLNWALIFGHWGAPRLELTGAALATFVSSLYSLVVLAWLTHRAGWMALGRRAWGRSAWTRPLFASILRIGGATYLQIFGEVGAFSCAAIMLGWLGAVPLAAHHITIQIASLSFMVPLGLSFAVSIRIGQAMGRKDPEAVRRVGIGSQGFVALWMLGMAWVILGSRDLLPRFFSSDPAVQLLAAQFLAITAFFQLFDGLQVVTLGMLRGMMDTRIPTLTCLVGYWLICLPLGYVMTFHTNVGAVGVWWALLIGLGFSAVGQMLRFAWLSARMRAA